MVIHSLCKMQTNNTASKMDKKIKTLKTLLIALGTVIVFSNSMGLLMNSMMFSNTDTKPISGVDMLFANFGLICITAITIGILLLIGGIILNSKNKWSRVTVIIISILSMICMISFSIVMAVATYQEGVGIGFSLGVLFSCLAFSTPFVILIVFLNKTVIIEHFT